MNKLDLSRKANQIRTLLGEDHQSPIDLFQLVHGISGLTLVFYPLGEGMSGICYKGKDSSVIAINSDMSIGRQRFSLAHELHHLYFDEGFSTMSMKSIHCDDPKEREANQFASYLLIPPFSLDKKMREFHKKISLEEVIHLEQYYGVSHKAMLYRLQDEKVLTKKEVGALEKGVLAKATSMGYDSSLYRPLESSKNKKVMGHYIKCATDLLDHKKISVGKYEELLLAAFRDDMVYGDSTNKGEVID